mmetsp:Transcript_3376/g.13466  ORF Transcript_3376/g.13466 Transcript_3376/m.13466 type:complete len:500 (-) Transcript_3376:121-1620(-)
MAAYDAAGFRESSRFSVAPMMEWTDRHYRFMARKLSRRAKLYTEMVVDDTLLHRQDNLELFLGHDQEEHPLALQLGGNRPDMLAEAVSLAQGFGGFCEINLNCGCPSPRVSKRCFGARLMLEPERTAQLVHEMARRATAVPVTVKCRIGADDVDRYEDLVSFVSHMQGAGADHVVVHARKCLLDGLSASQNRTVPPLRPWFVHRLAREFPDVTVILNGGITDMDVGFDHLLPAWWGEERTQSKWFSEAQQHADDFGQSLGGFDLSDMLRPVHGVMVGRAAYSSSWKLRHVDTQFYGASSDPGVTRRQILEEYMDYAERITRDLEFRMSPMKLMMPTMGLFSNEHGCRAFRRVVSEIYTGNRNLAMQRLNSLKERQPAERRQHMWERLRRLELEPPSPTGADKYVQRHGIEDLFGVSEVLHMAMDAVPERVLDYYDYDFEPYLPRLRAEDVEGMNLNVPARLLESEDHRRPETIDEKDTEEQDIPSSPQTDAEPPFPATD